MDFALVRALYFLVDHELKFYSATSTGILSCMYFVTPLSMAFIDNTFQRIGGRVRSRRSVNRY